MSMEVTSALWVTVTVGAAQHLAVVIGKNGGKIMTERWCRKQLSVTVQGFHRCTLGIRKGACWFACRCCERLEMVACDANMWPRAFLCMRTLRDYEDSMTVNGTDIR